MHVLVIQHVHVHVTVPVFSQEVKFHESDLIRTNSQIAEHLI